MSIKINVFDKIIREIYGKFISIIVTILTLLLIFFEIPEDNKVCLALMFVSFLLVVYFLIWIYANKKTDIKLNIEGSKVEIRTGNLFEQSGLKVIPFNEYFDTQVDDRIISKKSLNGQYVVREYQNPKVLNKIIKNDVDLNISDNIIENHVEREGNNTKYKLGSSIVINEYVLTAFTRFTNKNKAELTMYEYLNFLLYFWDEINKIYAQKDVSVPIFGSGITRFKNGFEDINDDELLSIMLWTFKISKHKFKYPAKLSIIIQKEKISRINIFKMKEIEK